MYRSDPVWSPDGKWIAYDGDAEGRAAWGCAFGWLRSDISFGDDREQRAFAVTRGDDYLVTRQQADRLCFGDAGTGDGRGERRSDGDHAIHVQADAAEGSRTSTTTGGCIFLWSTLRASKCGS